MKTTINAVIIDDEPVCVDNLAHHLSTYCPGIQVLARGYNLNDARNILEGCRFDIAFLDIELFDRNIFELLPDLSGPRSFDIVFVTAYDSYAIRAIRTDALDYLLKPLSRPDIEACYERILHRDKQTTKRAQPEAVPVNRKMILKQGERVYVARYSEILYMKALGAYTEVAFEQNGEKKTVMISKTINALEKECSDAGFCRVHKSYIVNTAGIAAIIRKGGLYLLLKNEDVIPVAKRRAGEFMGFYNNIPH